MHRVRVLTTLVFSQLRKKEEISLAHEEYLRAIFCSAEHRIEQGSSFRLLISTIFARADLAFSPTPERLQPLVDEILSTWEIRVKQAMSIAPGRTDLTVSYLLWLLRENRQQEFSRWALLLFNKNPEDPVGLWFSGIALLSDPSESGKSLKRMRLAIDRGIERMMPIDDKFKRALSN
jgi:hypothetical protein